MLPSGRSRGSDAASWVGVDASDREGATCSRKTPAWSCMQTCVVSLSLWGRLGRWPRMMTVSGWRRRLTARPSCTSELDRSIRASITTTSWWSPDCRRASACSRWGVRRGRRRSRSLGAAFASPVSSRVLPSPLPLARTWPRSRWRWSRPASKTGSRRANRSRWSSPRRHGIGSIRPALSGSRRTGS